MRSGTAIRRGFLQGRRYWPGAKVEFRETDQVPDWVSLDEVETDVEKTPPPKKKRKKKTPPDDTVAQDPT